VEISLLTRSQSLVNGYPHHDLGTVAIHPDTPQEPKPRHYDAIVAWHKRLANDRLLAMRMRGCRYRHGLARLVSAVAVVALIFANVVGAHAHATAHGPDAAHGGWDQHLATSAAAVHAAAYAAVDDAASGIAHEHGDPGGAHTTSCDFVCHGGVAILAASTVHGQVAARPAKPHVARSIDLLLTGYLERPPRPSIRA
jgi:hypothetical protein